MSALVKSVNVGQAEVVGSRKRPSGIRKQPVAALQVHDPHCAKGPSGVEGDFVGDAEHHGGTLQAVYAFAREELDWWEAELGMPLADGTFGENLTLVGLDVDGARVGDLWRVDEALLRVTGPRTPCSTFAAAMGLPGWVKRFADHGRPGAYLAVVEPGTIRAGAPVEVVLRSEHDIDMSTALRAFLGDRDLAQRVLAAGVLAPDDAAVLEQVAGRSGGGSW